ncbi:hypothetical protein ACFOJE_19930 [Azotobacter bryophylli]|jgi:hypothetical protein|uniref:Uncharacterized protein n=1 Tax=Azotobacter bryophylli TaxID=1986537 RepID=A0ABV7AXZ7_9GAMM
MSKTSGSKGGHKGEPTHEKGGGEGLPPKNWPSTTGEPSMGGRATVRERKEKDR